MGIALVPILNCKHLRAFVNCTDSQMLCVSPPHFHQNPQWLSEVGASPF